MNKKVTESVLAVVFAGAIIVAGAAAVAFFYTISPVHDDPSAVPSAAAAAPAPRYSGAVEEARRQARSLLVEDNLPGLSVAVALDGRIVWAEGFGWSDVEGREPVTPFTRFRIGGVSKPLTSAAVGLLHERGRLDLDAPVQQYVPAFPEKQWAFSTRQLMGHVAGVRSPQWEHESLPTLHCAGLDQALDTFRGDPLLFEPGTEHRYSIYGWVLVSAVVEAAAGEPYDSFMTREIFEPLGMKSTVLDEPGGVPGLASFYFPRAFERPDLGLQADPPRVDYSCWAGAGAFVSTPSDLVRFGSAMLKPGLLLNAETVSLLQAPLRLQSGASTGYALGWKVESVELAGAQALMLGHRGGAVGGTTLLATFPDTGLVIAAASNVSYAKSIAPFALKVAETFARLADDGVP